MVFSRLSQEFPPIWKATLRRRAQKAVKARCERPRQTSKLVLGLGLAGLVWMHAPAMAEETKPVLSREAKNRALIAELREAFVAPEVLAPDCDVSWGAEPLAVVDDNPTGRGLIETWSSFWFPGRPPQVRIVAASSSVYATSSNKSAYLVVAFIWEKEAVAKGVYKAFTAAYASPHQTYQLYGSTLVGVTSLSGEPDPCFHALEEAVKAAY